MALIYDTLKPFFVAKEVNEDNFVAKLFHKATFGFLILGAALVASNQYIGDPIKCNQPLDKNMDVDLLTTSCWIHGSYHLPPKFLEEASEKLPAFCARKSQDSDLTDEELLKETDTLYYQWVPFMLIINAIIFIIPHQLWKALSGGYLKKFCNKSTMNRDAHTTNEHFRDLAQYHADFFHEKRNQNWLHFIKFLAYEFLNLVALITVFNMTDNFLDNNFNSYGAKVINHTMQNEIVRATHFDPMCNAFPTLVSCSFIRPAVTKENIDTISTMCILSQNIINEKIYLFLWFWYVLLFTLSAFLFIYRMALIIVPGLRMTLMGLKFKRNAFSEVASFINNDCDISDWFLLYQIADNVDSYFLEQFVIELISKSHRSQNHDESNCQNNDEGKELIENDGGEDVAFA